MSNTADHSRAQQRVLARRLGAIALALFVVFAASVLARIIPFRVLLASWQLEFAASLIDAAPIALLGLILVHLAAYLDPNSPILKERKQRFSRFALAAVLGFLLLIPLNVYAVWTGLGNLEATRTRVEVDAVRRIDRFRQVVRSATTPEDLQQRLESIGVPGLRPSDLRQPLPRLKQQLLANLDKAQGNLEARKEGAGAVLREGLWSLIQSVLKLVVAALALAFAFAAGAQARNSDISLLESWQRSWDKRTQRGGRRRPHAPAADEDYLRQLSGVDDVS
ncbi:MULTISPECIES: hypothetical protein [unclassified Synechococcus]|uniref:hypothetical protein n=1 Tax=unclassified Synechococcus TaxID=2626047 RepID=UPI001689C07C|nr:MULTISPECIES: hypothetical protein [unclassified Synechococcus]MBD2718292.1 hypothetical protein [Synechococcus sp. FACHB-909]